MRKNSFGAIFFLQVKNGMHYFPGCFCLALVLCLAVCLLFGSLRSREETSDMQTKVRVGIVGDMSESYLGMGLSAIQTLDDSAYFCELLSLEEEEAAELLTIGDINCYVIFPAGFLDAVISGENKPATFVTTDGQEGIGTVLMEEIMDVVSELVLESQTGIYSLQDYLKSAGTEDYETKELSLNIEYIKNILNRNNLFHVEVIGVSHFLSMNEYYYCSLLLLLCMIVGTIVGAVSLGEEAAFSNFLRAKGYALWKQTLARYLAFALLLLFSLCFAMGVLYRFIPVLLLVGSLQFLLAELSDDVLGRFLLQFAGSFGMCFLSGCLYPISFFPKSLQLVGELLPTGVARRYMEEKMLGEGRLLTGLEILAYMAVFFALSVFLRRKKVEGCL